MLVDKVWLLVSIVIAVLLVAFCVALVIYFIKRERRLMNQIQEMLDAAIAGKFQDERLDESKISLIENNLWRYLCDKEEFHSRLSNEKQRLQAQISDISHQAVIPLANIVLYSQLVAENLDLQNSPESWELKDEIDAIREQAETLDFLIASLVKLSRLETGIINVKKCRQPLQPLLDILKAQFQAKAAQKNINFVVANTLESAVFDRKWTIEAMTNIVDNAIKYTPDGGTVAISVESYVALTRVDVKDTGPGIPEAEQANVFTRFYRSPAVSDKPGVGIGLYLAREVMKAQDGYIKLTSKPGEGSTFSLFFRQEEISQS